MARRGRLGRDRARQPARRRTGGARRAATSRSRPTSPRTPRSWGSRSSCSRRWRGPRSCSTPATAADVRRLPRLYTGGRLRVLRGPGRGRARATRTARPSWRPTTATTRASPATPSFIEALGAVYCGDLDRYVELTGDGRRAVRPRAGLRPRRRTSTVSSRRAGSRRRSRSPRSRSRRRGRSATRTGSSYALWIAGMAFSKADAAPRARGVGRGRRRRARAPRPVLRGLPRARRGAPAHLRRRARGRARCCSPTRSPRSTGPATCRS